MGEVGEHRRGMGIDVLKQFMAGEDRVVVLEDGMAEARWELSGRKVVDSLIRQQAQAKQRLFCVNHILKFPNRSFTQT